MYKLCFLVPEASCEAVKAALFAVGVGQSGNYDHCCWQTLGDGQFRPLAGSQPHIGTQDKLSTVREYKVECQVADDKLETAIQALHQAHPYEEPIIDVWRLVDI